MKKEKKRRLRRLAERKDARHSRRDYSQYVDEAELISGVISLTASGFGFVKPDSPPDAPDIFIPPQFVNGAMDGDSVKLALLNEKKDYRHEERGSSGRIVKVTGRKRNTLVGEVISGHTVRPMSGKVNNDIKVAGRLKGAKRGDWVEVKLLHTPDNEGTIVRNIGKAGSVKSDLDAICAEYDLEAPYKAEDDAEAAAIIPREIEREDLRKLFTVTIDPIDAKDFDDAISIAPGKERNTLEIGVHISDVAAFIAPKSKFDKEAAKRCFTAYLPGRTLPMLPKTLTAKISLHMGEDCPAHSVIFQIDKKTGKILEHHRCHSLIRVAHRLDYEEVQEFLDHGTAPESWSKTMQTRLKQLSQITQAMRKERMAAEKFIDLALPEIRVICDENADKVKGLARKIQRESEALIEECMLAANSAVGQELIDISVAGLYRIHAEPEPEKLEEFIMTARESFGVNPGDLTDRNQCCRFLAGLPDDPRRPVILSMFLRAMPRACYQENPAIHFGLGKMRYCHFTSPIRRYPDLTVHQQLWNYDKKQRTRSSQVLAALAAVCSEKEENNDNAYFAASDRLKLRYLQDQLESGRENFYEGVVAKVNANGLLVDIQELGIYGFVPVDNMPGGSFSRRSGKMSDSRNERQYRCGDYVYLKLSQIDPVKSRAEFAFYSAKRH